MLVSVIILTYNQSHILKYILHSLDNQVTNYNFEIIITDDGSNLEHIKNTFDLINRYSNLKIYFAYQQDMGPNMAKARNNGIKIARGDILTLIDGDIIPSVSFVEDIVNAHREDNNILLYSDRSFKDIDEINSLNLKELFKDSKNYKNIELEKREKKFKENITDIWQRVWSFNISFRKKSFTLFDEIFVGYGLEDAEFAYNLFLKHNYKIKKMDTKVIHVNEKEESTYNPYLLKNCKNISNFIQNAINFIKKYKEDSNIFIKSFYMPSIKENKTISFFDEYLFNKKIPEKELYKESIKCLENIIKEIK